MDDSDFIRLLLEQKDSDALVSLLAQHEDRLDDNLALRLKAQADYYLRTDVSLSQKAANALLQVAEHTKNPRYRALGLLAWGNIYSLGLGEYERSLRFYDEAAEIYRGLNDRVNLARSQIGKIWALLNLSRYEEVESLAEWASHILEEEGEYLLLAQLSMNRAVSRGRQGDDLGALAMFDRTRALLAELGEEGEPYIPWVDQNRSIVLRNLGRLKESLEAAESAWRGMEAHGELVEAARARQSMAITYLLLGRYNEALSLMYEARRIFLEDGRQRDALLLDLLLCDCLLPLRRFQDVLNITRHVRPFFAERGMQQEIGKALIDEAVAYAGLGRFDEARASLAQARQHFINENNPVLLATADLELAALLLHLDRLDTSIELLENAERIFAERHLKPQLARTWILQARVALRLKNWDRASMLAYRALDIAQQEQIISISFRAHHILGQILDQRGEASKAMAQYMHAIQHLERMYGHLMAEFQADFLEDKADIYEDAVLLAVNMGDLKMALELTERAKSRSLLNMIAHRIDLSLHARDPKDETLVEELLQLRRERDRALLRWETGEDVRSGKSIQEVRNQIWDLERRITQRWHQLLVRNADYAKDAVLWQIHTESPQPWLDEDTLLIEYFIAKGNLIALLIDEHNIRVISLSEQLAQIAQWLNLLKLNNHTFPWVPSPQQRQLEVNARALLSKLYAVLLAPFREQLQAYRRLIITPHGLLHYLPFHALHDGEHYLIETHEVSYLPASSLLRFSNQPRTHDDYTVAFGYSGHGRLPHAPEEARRVAEIMGGEAWLEDEVTLARVKQSAPRARVVHFATHGEFRVDNPLFAGILLADGWLTALDVFNLRLDASLVTLSACETGQHLLSGGDELLGLTRAFLYAGAASLLLSYWHIPDAIAMTFVERFYRGLVRGLRKATALREAQLALLNWEQGDDTSVIYYQHPFIWASFFLLGSPNEL